MLSSSWSPVDHRLVAILRRLLASLAFIAMPVVTAAQNVITVHADSTRRVIAPSSKFAVPVIIDMTAAGGTNLASLTTGVTFGASQLAFDSVRTVGFGTLTPATTSAAGGSLTLAVTDVTGTTVTQTLATIYFTALATMGGTTIAFAPTVAASATGTSVLALIRTRALDVCVAPGGKWGDVNGDSLATPLGDGAVNIIDAQQIARFSVALSVSNWPGIIARGDVTADGSVNIIDAQQIARFSVGLSVAVRVNTATFTPPVVASVTLTPGTAQSIAAGATLQLAANARDASSADVTPCATVSWTSSDTSVATVSPSGLVTAVAVGTATVTATSDGRSAALAVTAVYVWSKVEAGGDFTCGLTTTSRAFCWGRGSTGSLGNGDSEGPERCGASWYASGCSRTPVAVAGGPQFATLEAAFSEQVCGIMVSGALYCWGGDNNTGAFDNGTWGGGGGLHLIPTRVTSLDFNAVGVGNGFACGLTTNNQAYCWGSHRYRELGTGVPADEKCIADIPCKTTPQAVAGGRLYTAIASNGGAHSCALTPVGAVYCWGSNDQGELGNDSTNTECWDLYGGTYQCSIGPVRVVGGHAFKAITVGIVHTCALTTTGNAYCWGANQSGQLGNGQRAWASSTPTPVSGGLNFTSISAGGSHTCGVTSNHTAYCWGVSAYGATGTGTTFGSNVPVPVSGSLQFAYVSTSGFHSCGVTPGGQAYCWGLNLFGALGNRGTTDLCTDEATATYDCSLTPVPVFGQAGTLGTANRSPSP